MVDADRVVLHLNIHFEDKSTIKLDMLYQCIAESTSSRLHYDWTLRLGISIKVQWNQPRDFCFELFVLNFEIKQSNKVYSF